MPHPILEIDELLRLVVDALVETSPRSAVSFAITCRSLEELTLCSLWKKQWSLTHLMKVLPAHTWVQDWRGISLVSGYNFSADCIRYKFPQVIEHDPSTEDWARLQRYASWMRGLHLGSYGKLSDNTLHQLSSNSPGGVLFPRLKWLCWDVHETSITPTFFRLFLSPHLKRVILCSYEFSDIPSGQLAGLVQIISFLPTSIEDLTISCGRGDEEPLKDVISSFLCRSGSSLRRFHSNLPLSEAAIHHLMQLPHLCSWVIVQGVPRTISPSILPPLEKIHLREQVALPWLRLIASQEEGVLQNGSTPTTSHTNIRETLRSLICPGNTIIDSTFLSSILKFRNLVTLYVNAHCYGVEGCIFHLTDDGVENLAATLCRLKSLRLGQICGSNSCNTTIASLLSISVHCLDLTFLETHFNTLTIVGDIQRLLDGGSGDGNTKCGLPELVVGCLPLEVRGEDIETIVAGFKAIFPCLTNFVDDEGHWYELRSKLRD